MREIALDTETTGLNPKSGHKVVEIGCVEMLNHIATGEVFHVYINPERDMPEEAFRVHGLSEAFLKDHPVFKKVADDFLAFIGDDPLVIHNAAFDMGFLNWELEQIGKPALDMARTIDTVQMARKKFPGAQANLDALCRRFGIDNSDRDLHGALLDARLLADVYLELMGGRQTGLGLGVEPKAETQDEIKIEKRQLREARTFAPSEDEMTAHALFIAQIEGALWKA
ncbi:DNA polymerase III subunit epsilon [Magnetovibrio blakemorei]|uniref:DNA polymerase III subunit epsilon n=1 Tax=Magnetovibrio blakemorei TaxID=28181 RepID=A0A1E5Q3Y4_9PROT|nr:DNA polymerase III subunit epsilon [Magnetovibrio blakemorei]OEJ64418.1 DNA polymerase III subunit epsilon [Magnetovibrio blakemorei]